MCLRSKARRELLSKYATQAQRLIHQGDQLIARDVQPIAAALRIVVFRNVILVNVILFDIILFNDGPARFHAVVGFYAITSARFKQFSYFVSRKDLGSPKQ